MITFSVYVVETGQLTGAQVRADTVELVVSAVPDGCSVVQGDWDYLSFEVDHETGEVIPMATAAPDWRPRKAVAASAAYDEILRAEAQQARPLRELVQAMLSGVPASSETIARFEELKSRIDASRARYNAVLATTTEAELEAITILSAAG